MNHQPYERWLLSEEPLVSRDHQALQEHLMTCSACQRLATALQAVQLELTSAPMVAPAPGFVQRWQARLESQRSADLERRSWAVLVVSSGMTALLAIMMGFQWIGMLQKPTQFITEPVYQLTVSLSLLDGFREILLALLGAMPVSWWATIAAGLSLLVLVWAFTLSRFGGFSLKPTSISA